MFQVTKFGLPGLASLCLAACAAGGVTTATDPESGLRQWVLTARPMQLELIQRLPDQTRGFFLARGFSAEQAEIIAQSCVFQTIGRNIDQAGGATLVIDVHRWRLYQGDKTRSIPDMAWWEDVWEKHSAAASARTAFRWGTFPMRQNYEPDDYNWGMILFGIKPGETFDLQVRWAVAGVEHGARIDHITCAPDVERL